MPSHHDDYNITLPKQTALVEPPPVEGALLWPAKIQQFSEFINLSPRLRGQSTHLRPLGSRTMTSPSYSPTRKHRAILRIRKIPRPRKAQPRAWRPEGLLEAPWDSWLESELWRFPASVPLSPRVQSSLRLPALEPVERRAGSSEPWPVLVFPNTKPSAMKDA